MTESAPINGNEKAAVELPVLDLPTTPSTATVTADTPPAASSSAGPAATTTLPTPTPPPEHCASFVRTAKGQEIKDRLANEIAEILKKQGLAGTCCLAIIEPNESIDSYDLDMIFNARISSTQVGKRTLSFFF